MQYAARDRKLGEGLCLQYAARDRKLGEGSCCYGNGLSTHAVDNSDFQIIQMDMYVVHQARN